MAKACGVTDHGRECEEPKNKDTGDGFCARHSEAWRQSSEFNAALKDEGVRFFAGIPKTLAAALRP